MGGAFSGARGTSTGATASLGALNFSSRGASSTGASTSGASTISGASASIVFALRRITVLELAFAAADAVSTLAGLGAFATTFAVLALTTFGVAAAATFGAAAFFVLVFADLGATLDFSSANFA